MDELPQADELALHELEHLLYEKRRPISERKARAVVAAERAVGERLAIVHRRAVPIVPVYPPLTWRGAGQQDRFFRSLTLFPLRARVRWVVSAPAGSGKAEALVNLQTVKPSRRARWGHGLLTALEVLAAATLVVIVVLLYQRLQNLTPSVQVAQPTQVALVPSATASVATSVELLPGGHTPPDSAQQDAEVARAEVTLAEPPTPGPQAARRLVIARIQVDAPIVEGDTAEALKMGVGHHTGSADPGETGNMVVSAHNDIYGEIFRDLDKLESGDEVLVYTDAGAYRYVVNTVEIVAPTAVEVMQPTDHAVLTMITCYPYLLDTHRVVVVADLVE